MVWWENTCSLPLLLETLDLRQRVWGNEWSNGLSIFECSSHFTINWQFQEAFSFPEIILWEVLQRAKPECSPQDGKNFKSSAICLESVRWVIAWFENRKELLVFAWNKIGKLNHKLEKEPKRDPEPRLVFNCSATASQRIFRKKYYGKYQ